MITNDFDALPGWPYGCGLGPASAADDAPQPAGEPSPVPPAGGELCLVSPCARIWEAEHRIKNHLQLLASYTRLAGARPDVTPGALARDVADRILAIASVHEALQASLASGRTPAAPFLATLCGPFRDRPHGFAIDCAPDVTLSADQLAPVGMIVTEAITNAIKHAFPHGRAGEIGVGLARCDGALELRVRDSGEGLGGAQPPLPRGLKIIAALARQLHGSARLVDHGPAGAEMVVRFAGRRPAGRPDP